MNHLSSAHLASHRARFSGKSFLTKSLLAAASAFALQVAAASAAAQPQAQTYDISLKSQSLSGAFVELSQETGAAVFASSQLIAGRRAPAVNGAMTVDAALAALLEGSGLAFREDANGARIIYASVEEIPAKPAAGSAAEAEGPEDQVIVTGSRIPRSTFSSPTPISVIGKEEIETSGFLNVDDVLMQNPAFSTGLGSSNTYQAADAGAAFINLRGLGSNRSLVVINGRRRVSGASTSSAVDLNMIPTGMIERVEVITGGASAIYGADAVSGVVNAITRTDFEGLEFSARGGISDKGDAENYAFFVYGGTSFADDRGQMNFSVGYHNQAQLAFPSRSYGQNLALALPNLANTGPNDGVPDQVTSIDARFPSVTDAPNFAIGGTRYVYENNQLSPVDLGEIILPAGEFTISNGGDGLNLREELLFRTPQETVALRNDVRYELMDGVNFFVETEFTDYSGKSNDQDYFFFSVNPFPSGVIVQADNYYLPSEISTLMADNGVSAFSLSGTLHSELGGPLRNAQSRKSYTVVAGFDGELSNGWKWQGFYQYGENTNDITSENLLLIENFTNATDVIEDPMTGEPVCRNPAAQAAGCTPYNSLSNSPFTEDQRDYFGHTRAARTANTQQVFGAQLTGDLFEGPAGPVSFAFGAERRRERLQTKEDSVLARGDLGIVNTPKLTELDEEFAVTEGYAEFRAPILRDLPLVQSFEADGAVRYSDYNTIGSTVAWQAGVNWVVNEDLRIRATRARSVRAPNLYEIFQPQSESILIVESPCSIAMINTTANRLANCLSLGAPAGGTPFEASALRTTSTGGNPDLFEESSVSYTAGFVLTPGRLEGFSLSADYFTIQIDDAVGNLDTFEIVGRCFDAASLDNAFCSKLEFGAQGNVTAVDAKNFNIGSLSTSGVDIAAGYNFGAGTWGDFGLRFVGSYLLKLEQLVVAGDPSTLNILDGESTNPKFRFTATVNYRNGPWNASLANRYISAADIDRQSASPEYLDISRVSRRVYTDLTVGREIGNETFVYIGVNNLFDVIPPFTSATFAGASGDTSGGGSAFYDVIGRYAHAGARIRF